MLEADRDFRHQMSSFPQALFSRSAILCFAVLYFRVDDKCTVRSCSVPGTSFRASHASAPLSF